MRTMLDKNTVILNFYKIRIRACMSLNIQEMNEVERKSIIMQNGAETTKKARRILVFLIS